MPFPTAAPTSDPAPAGVPGPGNPGLQRPALGTLVAMGSGWSWGVTLPSPQPAARGLAGCQEGCSRAAALCGDMEGEGQHHDGKPEKEPGLDGSTEPLNRVEPKIWTLQARDLLFQPQICGVGVSWVQPVPQGLAVPINKISASLSPRATLGGKTDRQATRTTTYITGRWQALSGAHYITFTVKASLNQDITQRTLTLPRLSAERTKWSLTVFNTLSLPAPRFKDLGWSPLLFWSSHPAVTLGHSGSPAHSPDFNFHVEALEG